MDFSKIIQDLLDWGMTQIEIKELVGCGQSTISDLLNGKTKRPSFDTGQALLNLHEQKKPQEEMAA